MGGTAPIAPARSEWGHTARLAAALVARRDLLDALRVLGAEGIVAMPLKGVLLQHLVYRDPAERIISDADVLIPPGRYREALAALRRAGYVIHPASQSAAATQGPDAELQVDVHPEPFPYALFSLSARELFARGRLDHDVFGASVVIPAPLDLYAHLVGNFVKGRQGASAEDQLRDFAAVASHFSLSPVSIARHLEAHGLRRAARHALPLAVARGDSVAAGVLRALGGDPVGVLCAKVASRLIEGGRGGTLAGVVAPHLLNRTLPAGARSFGAHLAVGLSARARRWRRGRARTGWGPGGDAG